ncbi:MAG: hypothetical protein ACRDRL_27805 [Sciscionella sp.]
MIGTPTRVAVDVQAVIAQLDHTLPATDAPVAEKARWWLHAADVFDAAAVTAGPDAARLLELSAAAELTGMTLQRQAVAGDR